MFGTKMDKIPCILFTDCLDLHKTLHGMKPVADKRLQVDLAELKQTYSEQKLIQEIRHIHADRMLADGLTKPAARSDGLLHVLQTGRYQPAGDKGWTIKADPTAFSKLWVATPSDQKQANLARNSDHVTTENPHPAEALFAHVTQAGTTDTTPGRA